MNKKNKTFFNGLFNQYYIIHLKFPPSITTFVSLMVSRIFYQKTIFQTRRCFGDNISF